MTRRRGLARFRCRTCNAVVVGMAGIDRHMDVEHGGGAYDWISDRREAAGRPGPGRGSQAPATTTTRRDR